MTATLDIFEAAEAAFARSSLASFSTHMDAGYCLAPHVEFLCNLLEAIERNEVKHAIICVPPRHGKTRLVSNLFPAWWLGRHPGDEIILASNSSELGEDNSAIVRNLLNDERYPFATRVSADTSAKNLWRTTQGGIVKAAGVGSSIQGRGGHLLICDDPVQNAADATTTAFDHHWRWFTRDFFKRRLAQSHVILSMFRWGDGDLAGRILENPKLAKDWFVCSLPAIAPEHDIMGREPGSVLWEPQRHNGTLVGYGREFLGEQRELDPGSYAAQYDLNPIPDAGVVFQREYFEHRYDILPDDLEIYQAIDSAWKSDPQADRSVIATIGYDGSDLYIIDVTAGRWNYHELERVVAQEYEKHYPRVVFVEAAASGFALIARLRDVTCIPIEEVSPGRDSKVARMSSTTGWFSTGRVKFPRHASWLDDTISEFLRVPGGRHDDVPDAICLGIRAIMTQVRERKPYFHCSVI